MSYTAIDLLQNSLGILAFCPLFLAPGYLLCATTDLAGFRECSGAEQFLRSLVFSLPLSLSIAAIVGRYLPAPLISSLFFLITLAGIFVFTRTRRRGVHQRSPQSASSSTMRIALLAMAALTAYLLLVTVSLQIGPRLFESVSASDWSIRVPLVAASIRDGVPPGNPFFTLNHHPQSARYYFYWYALCAIPARLTGLSARPCLAASVVWSSFSLAALLLLCLKHLVGTGRDLPRQCLLALALCCVSGLDVVPSFLGLFTHPMHLYPEIEWWHDDRIPSFLGALVFAPHHIGGMVCALTGMLLLVLTAGPSADQSPTPRSRPPTPRSWPRVLLAALTAGLCFAATAGSSTYIAFIVAIVGALYGLDLLRRRRWVDLLSLSTAATVSLLLSLPFLHSLLTGPALPPLPGHSQARFLQFTLRNLTEGERVVGYIPKLLHHGMANGRLKTLLATPFALAFFPLEFGFFLFPLAVHIHRDLARLRARLPFSLGERTLWAVFLGALLAALFLSSAPTQGTNDLGRHAGLILRFVTILWSTPIVAEYWEQWRAHQIRLPRPVLACAVVFLALGLATQLWQIVADRGILLITHYAHIHIEPPFSDDTDLGGRYYDLRRGLETVEAHLPTDAVVQSNPGSRFQLIVMLYSRRQFSAGDISCEAAFGGDLRQCKPMVEQLEHLFGAFPDAQPVPLGPLVTVPRPDVLQTATPAGFRIACRDQHLAAIVAENSDPAWNIPTSWVWRSTLLYATPRIRILACPAEGAPAG